MRRTVVLSALSLALSGCSTPVYPPLAARHPGDAAFKATIAERYRPGSPAAFLRNDLAAQGFTLVADPAGRRFSGLFRAGNLPCYSQVHVDWTEDGRGRIAQIGAQRHDCT